MVPRREQETATWNLGFLVLSKPQSLLLLGPGVPCHGRGTGSHKDHSVAMLMSQKREEFRQKGGSEHNP